MVEPELLGVGVALFALLAVFFLFGGRTKAPGNNQTSIPPENNKMTKEPMKVRASPRFLKGIRWISGYFSFSFPVQAKPKPVGPFTRADVALHSTRDDAWIIIDDKVYDITNYIELHPGGEDAIIAHIGGDGSKGFHGDQHPPTVWDAVVSFYIGDLVASEVAKE